VLVGAGALVIQDARDGQIVRVSVDPPHRCRGIGRALVTRLLDAARARGLTRVWMETNDDWHAAIAPYRHYTPQAVSSQFCGGRSSNEEYGEVEHRRGFTGGWPADHCESRRKCEAGGTYVSEIAR